MEFNHVPVLYEAVLESLDIKEKGIYVDGTLGGGGHSAGICSALSEDGMLIGIDRDTDALEAASKRLSEYKCRKAFVHNNYSEIKFVLNELDILKIDGALLESAMCRIPLSRIRRREVGSKNSQIYLQRPRR